MGNFFSVSNWEEADVMAELEECKAGQKPGDGKAEETKEACMKRVDEEACEEGEEGEACTKRKTDKKAKECAQKKGKEDQGSNKNKRKETKTECETRVNAEKCQQDETPEDCTTRKNKKKAEECKDLEAAAPAAPTAEPAAPAVPAAEPAAPAAPTAEPAGAKPPVKAETIVNSSNSASTGTSNPTPQTGGDGSPLDEDDVPSENTFAARIKNNGELYHGGAKKRATRKARSTRRVKARTAPSRRRKSAPKPTEP